MDKDKLGRLVKYQSELKDKLSGSIPSKHTTHPESYKAFLNNELRMVTLKIDSLKMAGAPVGK